ncbi:MAG: radical SAM protein [Anaerolineae bacterium]|nr:radical SAM protein [Anaerolineae bacterium]
MVKEIEAKVLLGRCKDPEGWFGVMYNMNLYRGCEHHCIYCDSRSDCYQIADFDGELLVKANAIDLLRKELASKRVKGTVGTGSMQDPYTPSEARLNMTGQALDVIAQMRYPVHILTKSDLVLRDVDVLVEINKVHASVCLTVTTADDALGKVVEPGAPSVSRRFAAAKVLAERGIQVGITLMPVLPFIEDSEENIAAIVARAHAAGVSYIVPWFGMSLRAGQREHYYAQLDAHFPGLRARYEATYGDRYTCACPNARRLSEVFHAELARYGMGTSVRPYRAATAQQMPLF